MSTPYVKYSDNLLLTKNSAWSLCCCEPDISGSFWESIPCDMFLRPRHDAVCDEWDQCQFINRQFVATGTICQGEINKICECQLFIINNWNNIITSSVSDFITIYYSKSDGAIVTWTNEYLELFDPNNGTVRFNFNINTTLGDVWDWVNTIPNYSMDTPPSSNFSYYIIQPESININIAFGTAKFDTKPSRQYFVWQNSISDGVAHNSNGTTFASNMNTVLQNLISSDISVTYNASGDSSNQNGIRWFETTFTNDLCGIRQPNIIPLNTLIAQFGSNYTLATPIMEYGDYKPQTNEDYLQPQTALKVYYNLQTKNLCGYEDISAFNPMGPNYFHENLQCCPQRGTTMGPNQTVGFENSIDMSGYGYNPNPSLGLGYWWNLNHSVALPIINDNFCYHLPPSYFVFGKPGKLTYNYDYDKELHISQSNVIDDNLANNCTLELFIAQFHKDVPWGPFGSYYYGIENTLHLAWDYPYNTNQHPNGNGPSFLSQNYPRRYGYDYRPFGWMKTRGSWRYTEEIELYIVSHRPLPFYVGTNDWDDFDYYIEIEPTSIINDLQIDYKDNPGCGAIGFYFTTSGKTVGDFLDAMNALRIKDYGCSLFSFCPASEQARELPSNKIINISCELFEQEVEGGGDPFVPGNDGPWQDAEKWGGCDIPSVPLSYPDMHALSLFNHLYLYGYIGQTYFPHPEVKDGLLPKQNVTPPICRFFEDALPRHNTPAFWFDQQYDYANDGPGYGIRKSHNLWWTNIPGEVEPIINIRIKTTDPNREIFDYFNISVTSGVIYLEGSGTNVYQTGTVDTNHNGSGYLASDCVDDLNSLTFINDTTFQSYNPVTAGLTENVIHDIFLDHSTWDDGSGGNPNYDGIGSLTDIDFSYKEPLENMDVVDIASEFASVNLMSWIRRRCGIFNEFNTERNINPYCVPIDSQLVNTNINCDGDEVHDEGWLISYGCASFVCKTEWYLKSTRCPCSQVYRCSEDNDGTGSNQPHPLNQQGGTHNNADLYGGFMSVSQPTFYMCEYNMHPECDIPFLIKVPFQVEFLDDIFCDGFPIAEGSIGYENGIWGRWLNGDPNVNSDCLLGSIGECAFCCDAGPVGSNIYGWCQYIDPLGPKVKEEDIPRTNPPTAIVAGRSNTTFCSIHPWNFRPENIHLGYTINGVNHYCPNLPDGLCAPQPGEGANCINCPNNGACAKCGNWDRIENAVPLYDYGYGLESLVVLARPIVKNLTGNDVCGNGDCSRWDVTCATACCECFFICNVSTECYDVQAKHPFAQITTYDKIVDIDNLRFNCIMDFYNEPCDYTHACCYDSTGGTVAIGLCPLGSCIVKEETHVTRVMATCGCSTEGCTEYTYTCDTPDCPDAPDQDCFTLIPNPPETPDPYCFDCNDALLYGQSTQCCSEGCYSIGDRNFDDCPGVFDTCSPYFDEFTKYCSTSLEGNCGKFDATWHYIDKDIYEGVSTIDGANLGFNNTSYLGDLCDAEYTTTIIEQGSYHVSVPMYISCNVDMIDGKSYEYITNWIYNVIWPCGYGNLGITNEVESNDSRFMGSEGCF